MGKSQKHVIFILLFYFLEPFDIFKSGNFINSVSGLSQKLGRFISFDSNDGKIEVELDLAVPFVSIPFNTKKEKSGLPTPLLTVNTQGIVVMGILVATSAFIVPLFFKPISTPNTPGQRFRMEEDAQWTLGNRVNEVLLNNGLVTPCLQRILCSMVTTVKNTDHPTSTDKIIDGVVSHTWFEQFVNGSVLMDAITTGQGSQKDCDAAYKSCPVSQQMIANSLRLLSFL
ncbi:uncharacterized protein LOC122512476 [Leptopilina heterotoma]|uniref:uncharacterized protein LOC122512476 n=1 Tax=Leptopilina heterotoma TaxID=63436 RepID=UPI001CA870B4|nr:uncharacterized protein LOC122512476 [Leptopilina heterotoma]